jgi:transposase
MNNEETFLSHFYGDHIRFLKFDQKDDQTMIYLKSTSTTAVCPVCGMISNHRHSTKKRVIQDMPTRVGEVINLTFYQYDCDNVDCPQNVFNESFSFFDKCARRTIFLNQLILAIAFNFTYNGTSRILGELGINISDTSIARMIEHIEIKQEPVKRIAVDDVSWKKGKEYYTAIYDMDTHQLVALLEGRDGIAFENWLKGNTQVEIVARDRATAYAEAIKKILPNCMQVADRFHIMQNLLSHMKTIIENELPYCVYIKDGVIVERKNKSIDNEKFSNEPVYNPTTGAHIVVYGAKKAAEKHDLVKKNSNRFKRLKSLEKVDILL